MRVVTLLPMDREFEVSEELRNRRASRRAAVGLAGVAPCLVPRHGHSALIPDASGPVGLRAALAHPWCRRGGAVLLFPSTYHGVLAVKGCTRFARLHPDGRR